MLFNKIQKSIEEHHKELNEDAKELSKLRNTIIQAQIVKIMKGRKTEKHNELISEVIRLINSFKPEIKVIKQQIEWLIENDFLTRDTNEQ